jgi:hypothetical protein
MSSWTHGAHSTFAVNCTRPPLPTFPMLEGIVPQAPGGPAGSEVRIWALPGQVRRRVSLRQSVSRKRKKRKVVTFREPKGRRDFVCEGCGWAEITTDQSEWLVKNVTSRDFFGTFGPAPLPGGLGLLLAACFLGRLHLKGVADFDGPHQAAWARSSISSSLCRAAAQSVRRTISKLLVFLVAMSLVPFVCAELPEEWRLGVLTTGIVWELFAGAILYLAHSRWHARHRDYCLWLRLVYRRVGAQ